MAAVVLTAPDIKFTFPSAAQFSASSYVKTVEIVNETEILDAGTFAKPKAKALGSTESGATITMLFDPTTYDKMSAYSGIEGTMKVYYSATGYFQSTGATYGAINIGSFEGGQLVEQTVPVVVNTAWTRIP